MRSINPTLLVMAMVANFLVIRVAGLFLPDQYYFSFSSFLFDTRDLNKPVALFFKLLVPFLAAFGLCAVLILMRRMRAGLRYQVRVFDDLLKEQAPITLCFAGTLVTLLMAWPYILLWDVLIDPRLQPHRLLFLTAYLAYIISVSLFALAGANTAMASLYAEAADEEALTVSRILDNRYVRPATEVVTGALSAALATFLAGQAA